jgi:short-subunit dehydrogenase
MQSFHDKVIIITGASSGIGKACALEFANRNAIVVLASRNETELLKVESEIKSKNGTAFSVRTDVRNEADCRNLVEKTIKKYGKIDMLINNAGISMRANFIDMDFKVIKEVMDTNFYGTVYCTKFALPYLLKQKGMVIGISSITGLTPLPGRTIYAASKHALNGFLNTLRIEHMKEGLKVLIIHPFFTSSNIRKNSLTQNGMPQMESPRNENKMMSAEKVAKIITQAAFNSQREQILTIQGKLIVWLYRFFPRMADKILLHEMKKEPNAQNILKI